MEIVRVSHDCYSKYQEHVSQLTATQLKMEILVLQDLIRQIDPEHAYFFSQEYGGFIKTKAAKAEEE